jgi:toxin ParE1/3/4
MRLVLHPKVYSDIDEIMGYYERVATPGLAEEFYTELRYFMTKAADKPESFSIRERDIRRANLRRFPYHFLFRVVGHEVRILVVRHHHRHPSLSPPGTNGFRSGISIRVEICGKEWNQNCSFFVVKLLTKFSCVLAIVCLPQ